MKKLLVVLVLAIVLLGALVGLTGFAAETEIETAVETVPVTPESESHSASEETKEEEEAPAGLKFSTTGLDGSAVDESLYQGKRLTLLNFWEPWCGSCVQSMPELQKLYEAYKDDGFQIIGIYSYEAGVAEIVEKQGVSYPIIEFCNDFAMFRTGYVPTFAFLNAEGQIVGNIVVGARSYEAWAEQVEVLLADEEAE